MRKRNPLAFINPVRVILALSIVLLHMPFGFEVYRPGFASVIWGFREMSRYGSNQAFLLIAGMMFFVAYYGKLRSGELKIGNFFLKRVLHIVPAVFVTVLTVYVIHLISHFTHSPDTNINVLDLLIDLLFFGKRYFGGEFATYNPPIWFLSALFMSYFVACFVIFVTKKKPSILWMLIPLFVFFLAAFGVDLPIFFLRRAAIDCFNFFLGIFFMLFLTKFVTFRKCVTIPVKILCGLVAAAYLFLYYFNKGNNPIDPDKQLGNALVWMPLFTILYGSAVNVVFDNKFFKVLSGTSLYIYLWHSPMYTVWQNFCIYFGLPGLKDGYLDMCMFIGAIIAISIGHYFAHKAIFKKISEKFKPKEA